MTNTTTSFAVRSKFWSFRLIKKFKDGNTLFQIDTPKSPEISNNFSTLFFILNDEVDTHKLNKKCRNSFVTIFILTTFFVLIIPSSVQYSS